MQVAEVAVAGGRSTQAPIHPDWAGCRREGMAAMAADLDL